MPRIDEGYEETERRVTAWAASEDIDWSRDRGPVKPQLATEVPGNPAEWSHKAWPVQS